jgi:tetratricopeptide (TPR) repeat protein
VDPLTTAAAASAATGAAKGIGGVAGRHILTLLGKRTQRIRVARVVSKKAKSEGVVIRARRLAAWLKGEAVREAVAGGDVDNLRIALGRLEFELTGAAEMSQAAAAARVVELVRNESLRRETAGDGRVAQTLRLEQAIQTTAREQRVLLTAGGDEVAFTSALEKIHPWRATTARDLAAQWTPFRGLVITLAGERARRSLLEQWAASPPAAMVDAPAEAWCWLACVAADYGANPAVVAFVTKGVDAGASESYWWARAGLSIGTGTPEDAAIARDLWSQSVPKHPLASAGEAIEEGDYPTAEKVLESWDSEDPNDQSIKVILLTAAATGRGDFNRAIAIGIEGAAKHPEGSGNTLRTAEALLSRGHHGLSEHPLGDFARAFDLAIQARDARRTWLGDSVAPILTAVKAAALATDIDQAWRLTQTPPEGTALPHESRDLRLRRESAILAATMGRFENALAVAESLDDPFVTFTVAGWNAFADDRPQDAEEAWLRAWEHAPNDTSRLQTASALAPLGKRLPDLAALPPEYGQAVDHIKSIHEVMSSDEDMSLLRARASDSEQLTVLLAERLAAQGQTGDAAAVLEAGGTRWNHPLMMRMAAARYQTAGSYEKAFDAAATALSLGGPTWAGRLETLMIQFDSLESRGEFARSLAVVREMATIAPRNLTVRWALVHSLVRAGSIRDAWRALTHEGRPVVPRDAGDARTWIGLAAECDDSPEFVQRSLEMMSAWVHQPDVVGVFLIQIYRGLNRHDRDVADSDIAELHKATADFTAAHPENQVFQSFKFDENDVVGSLTAMLKDHATEDPEIKDLRDRVGRGELPLGFVVELTSRTYVEACIKTAAGLVFSHMPPAAAAGKAAAAAALGSRVVIDASAASTLSLLDPSIVDKLVGAFLALETTDSAFRDALGAQQSLNMRSTMTLGWDDKQGRPLITETSEEEADGFARRADLVVELLTRSERRGWPGLKRFAELAGDGVWLSALDLAMSEQRAFWCDDRSLRQLAASEGANTFGTVDLLSALEAAGMLDRDLGVVARAKLVAGYHVDLDFDDDVLTHAAEIDSWEPKGAAAALTRTHSWVDPAACVRFAATAMARISAASPSGVAHWTTAVALGLIRITDQNADGASENLKILLMHQFTQHWLRPDTLPFVMQGIRAAMDELPGTIDPLAAVLAYTYGQISERHGAPQAAEFLLMLVANLSDDDRATAARIILTSES